MRGTFAEAVEAIYRAVEEPALWADALAALLAADAGVTGSLTTFVPGSTRADFVANRGFSERALQLYADYYYSVDPLGSLWMRPTPGVVLGQDHVPAEVFARSEIWNDYSSVHLDAFHIIGASLPLFDGHLGVISLQRPRAAAAFGPADQHELGRFLPHLQSALRLRQRLASVRSPAAAAREPRLGFAVLDALEVGIVVVRADGTVAFANAAARSSPALVIGARHQPVATGDPAAERALHAAIRDAATGGAGGAVALHRPGRTTVAALVSPLPPGLADEAGHRDLALVALRPLAPGHAPISPRLRALFGLTPAEAALAVALLSGQRPEEIAAARGVKISTVRFQLRAVLDKTGARGQSDLVRLLARLTPFRGDGEDGPAG